MTVQMTMNKSARFTDDAHSDRLQSYFIKLILVLMMHRQQVLPPGRMKGISLCYARK